MSLPAEVYDCRTCGACCREAFDVVEVEPEDPFVVERPDLVEETPFLRLTVKRAGPRCACLVGDGPYTCAVYAIRPRPCRDVEPGGEACTFARGRVGLPV